MTKKYDEVEVEEVSIVEPVQMTTWVNNQDRTVKFSYLTSKVVGKRGSGVSYQNIILKPGQAVKIPSEFDSGIRDERKGVVVGGLAPFLLKKGEDPDEIKLHPCLDYKNVTSDLELQELAMRLKKEDELRRAVEHRGNTEEAKKVAVAKKAAVPFKEKSSEE